MDTVTETTEEEKATFKEKFITPYPPIEAQQIPKGPNLEVDMLIDHPNTSINKGKGILQDKLVETEQDDDDFICLTDEEKKRIYQPWTYSIIIKIFGKKNQKSLQRTLQHGHWFINGYFLSVKRWHPNFVAYEAMETYYAIWIRLLELPTEFYDHSILAKVGKKLGKLVKTDVCTSVTL
ncbi:hypothetical protein R3W88_021120 [Solanum pinnatisectum]|uniref:DUF4283 domain-containing protein n=1 Tax=Solanum pinnatisectum TaxID=50273 RepID=A0AAV9LSB2_9SOLN|nr:hypothetical protein R3W88_021120 [Solanum pinnatisectum]